jgi:hypothetical protein
MFIVALFTIAKVWNQARCASMDDWIKKMWSIYLSIYLSWNVIQPQKEWNVNFTKMDDTRRYHLIWNKPHIERQVPHVLSYVEA